MIPYWLIQLTAGIAPTFNPAIAQNANAYIAPSVNAEVPK